MADTVHGIKNIKTAPKKRTSIENKSILAGIWQDETENDVSL